MNNKAAIRTCQKEDDCKENNGNCRIPGTDGLPVQCVGPWVEDKYFFLERYLSASREARRKFTDKGNAIFIDLFSGSGRCIIKKENKEINNGGFRALKDIEIPFNEYFYFDISKTNTDALSKRIGVQANCQITCGDSNALVDTLTTKLFKNSYRYHFAYIDPFGPDGLKFETLRKLAKLQRMDMLIHFPIGAIKRNLPTWKSGTATILDEFLGTDEWRKKINEKTNKEILSIFTDIFKQQLESISYPVFDTGLKSVPIKNSKDVDLYVLILASKHPLAKKIWDSIIKINRKGQKELF